MKNRTHLYVSRRNPATWLLALCLVGSAVARFVLYSGVKGVGLWSQILLPAIAALMFAAIILFNGKEFFFKTALPVWLLGICYAIRLYTAANGYVTWAMYCICILFYCLLYTWVTCGFVRWPWLLLPLHAFILGGAFYRAEGNLLPLLPELLLFSSLVLISFAVKVHTDDAYHPTWGDRVDGRRIRSIPAMDQISPYIMVHRNESSNFFEESAEITNAERYIRKKRKEGLTNFGINHLVLAAYVRTIAKYPGLNRFMAGQKVYSRGEDIVVCMTVKKEMSTSSPDTVIKVHFTPRDTAEDVYRKFNEQVETAKNTPLESGTDNTAGIMALIPGLALKFVVWLLKVLDYFGLIPKFLLEVSPFHGTAYFTSMGSLGIRPVYHHLYNFGTIPVFVSFGRKRRSEEIHNGEIVERKYVDLRFTTDERICDGYYYASLIKHYFRILHNPEVLDQPPEEVVKDIP